ncbi:protein-tyrosine-phosphatase [Sphingomonas sp. HDW15A]|uniref:metallophosphoesterase n=1 Tax=Sphingomonas sp. HDW15A TaxID=2714942 RepID=UPI00140A540B|nr:metallophosphoesterase [Sphingomonas sp. HDW15A]QIK96464.1 protein-tyrosine-phosphatase [Sphingomonas sp. HDW15A]
MVRRLLMVLAALTASLSVAAVSQPTPPRIVAVGDLHGDYAAWIDIAKAARLIGPNLRWTGGKTILVQTGDITDRGPDSLKIIRHLQQLQRQARGAGGNVIVVLGNHEAMQVTGDLRYVHAGEYAAFADRQSQRRRELAYEANKAAIETYFRTKDASLSPAAIKALWIAETPLGKVEHNTAWAPNGELGKWAASLPAVVKVGNTLFAHGGISANYALVPIGEVNRRARAALESATTDRSAIINDEFGPLWYRGLVTGTGAGGRPTAANELAVALKAYGAKRLVIGHTPSLKGVVIDFDGQLVRIDTGISRAYGGVLGWVEIVGDKVIPNVTTRSSP